MITGQDSQFPAISRWTEVRPVEVRDLFQVLKERYQNFSSEMVRELEFAKREELHFRLRKQSEVLFPTEKEKLPLVRDVEKISQEQLKSRIFEREGPIVVEGENQEALEQFLQALTFEHHLVLYFGKEDLEEVLKGQGDFYGRVAKRFFPELDCREVIRREGIFVLTGLPLEEKRELKKFLRALDAWVAMVPSGKVDPDLFSEGEVYCLREEMRDEGVDGENRSVEVEFVERLAWEGIKMNSAYFGPYSILKALERVCPVLGERGAVLDRVYDLGCLKKVGHEVEHYNSSAIFKTKAIQMVLAARYLSRMEVDWFEKIKEISLFFWVSPAAEVFLRELCGDKRERVLQFLESKNLLSGDDRLKRHVKYLEEVGVPVPTHMQGEKKKKKDSGKTRVVINEKICRQLQNFSELKRKHVLKLMAHGEMDERSLDWYLSLVEGKKDLVNQVAKTNPEPFEKLIRQLFSVNPGRALSLLSCRRCLLPVFQREVLESLSHSQKGIRIKAASLFSKHGARLEEWQFKTSEENQGIREQSFLRNPLKLSADNYREVYQLLLEKGEAVETCLDRLKPFASESELLLFAVMGRVSDQKIEKILDETNPSLQVLCQLFSWKQLLAFARRNRSQTMLRALSLKLIMESIRCISMGHSLYFVTGEEVHPVYIGPQCQEFYEKITIR